MVFQKLKADSLQLSKGVGAENGNRMWIKIKTCPISPNGSKTIIQNASRKRK